MNFNQFNSDYFPKGKETILVADDREDVLDLASDILRECGYTVLKAKDGNDALDLSKKYDKPIQLLLTDVRMTGKNGGELAEALLEIRPEIRVLYMSGYTSDIAIQDIDSNSKAGFIQKPFSFKEIALKVRELLDK